MFLENEAAIGSSCECFFAALPAFDPEEGGAPDDEKGAENQGMAAEDDVVAVLQWSGSIGEFHPPIDGEVLIVRHGLAVVVPSDGVHGEYRAREAGQDHQNRCDPFAAFLPSWVTYSVSD